MERQSTIRVENLTALHPLPEGRGIHLVNKMKHKFNAKPTTYNEKRYGSKLEASYAKKLDTLKKSGQILFYLEQVPFRLPGNTIYRLDFMEFWAPVADEPGEVIFTECKGFDTPQGKLKIAQCEDLFKIKINVVRKT